MNNNHVPTNPEYWNNVNVRMSKRSSSLSDYAFMDSLYNADLEDGKIDFTQLDRNVANHPVLVSNTLDWFLDEEDRRGLDNIHHTLSIARRGILYVAQYDVLFPNKIVTNAMQIYGRCTEQNLKCLNEAFWERDNAGK